MLKVDNESTAIGWMAKIEDLLSAQAQAIEELQTAVSETHDKIETAKNEAIVAATGGDVLNG